MPTDDIGDKLLRGQRRQTLAMVVLYLVVIVSIVLVWLYANRTRDALCTFRSDLVQRVQSSRDFLAAHPHGISGISAAAIQLSIDNQQRTIDSLSGLHCNTSTEKGTP